MTPQLQAAIELHSLPSACSSSDPACGTVPGAILNELQREWMIQRNRADQLALVIAGMERKSYLPQLADMTEKRDRLALALRDAISTFGPQKEILVTAERREAWAAVLKDNS